MIDVLAWTSLTSKDAKEIIFSTIPNMVKRLYASFWKCEIFRRLDYNLKMSMYDQKFDVAFIQS